jgi:putative phage-type endonuclease
VIKQRSEEWFKQRVGRITGSRVGAILGVNPWETNSDALRAMVREYHGAESEFKGNVATEYGTANEHNVQWAYELAMGETVEECGFYPYEDWLGASPDGLVGKDGLVEFKAPFSLRNGGKFKTLAEQPYYYAQVQIEMLCAEREWCDFVQWSPELPLSVERVYVDYDWLSENLPRLMEFHENYRAELNNPEHLEPLRKKVTSMAAIQLAEEYAELKDAIDRAKERQADIMEELKLYSGGKNAKIGDFSLTKVERKGSVSYSKVVKEHCKDVDLKPYAGKPSTYWTLK